MRISDWSSDVCSSDLRQSFAVLARIMHSSPPNRNQTPGCVSGRSDRDIDAHGDDEQGERTLEQHLVGGKLPAEQNAQCCPADRSEEHTSELQSLMRISYAVLCLKKKNKKKQQHKPRCSQK